MLVRSRVRSLTGQLSKFSSNEPVHVAFAPTDASLETLSAIGFTAPLVEGEQLLPPGTAGIASRRNAEGDEIVHKDQPMETWYRQKQWTWEEFRGRYDKVERSKIVEVPYKRYPRTFVPPHGVELRIRTASSGQKIVVAGPMAHQDDAALNVLLNTVHMFVELFGQCELLRENLTGTAPAHIKRLNWEVLPPGKYPWSRAQSEVARVVSQAKPFDHAVLESRYKEITGYEPDFIAIGRNGFSRYVVYGWEHKRKRPVNPS